MFLLDPLCACPYFPEYDVLFDIKCLGYSLYVAQNFGLRREDLGEVEVGEPR